LSEMELMCDRVAIIQAGKLIDVRTLREMVSNEGEQQATEIEVDKPEAAVEVLKEQHPNFAVQQNGDKLELTVAREQIPDVVHSLVMGGIKIYAVHSVNKSLEDTFLEITGGGSDVV
jgi:ABC-2 type transport system ATP-binding protein